MKFLRNLALLLVCTASAAHAQTPVVVQIDLEDTIQPVSAGYVKEGLNHAKDVNARAVILRLNTPGGLVDSMREIVEAILSSPVPVITWVGPNGARAASAGFFILLAGDLAVMAPGTSTGAAHPVSLTGPISLHFIADGLYVVTISINLQFISFGQEDEHGRYKE